jgi:hypothetical protein
VVFLRGDDAACDQPASLEALEQTGRLELGQLGKQLGHAPMHTVAREQVAVLREGGVDQLDDGREVGSFRRDALD